MSGVRIPRSKKGEGLAILLWGLGYVALGVAIATIIAWPIYESSRLIVVAAIALVLATAIVLVARRFQLPWWGIVLGSVLVYAIAVVPLAVPSAMGSLSQVFGGVRDGIAGITLGWKQLLTLDLPLGEYQAVLVPFFVTVYVATLVAVAGLVRGGKAATIAVPAVVAMSAFGVVFGSSNTSDSFIFGPIVIPAGREVTLAVVLIVLSLVWLIGRGRLSRARALGIARARTGTVRQRNESVAMAFRRNALAVAIVLVALAAGAVFAPFAATVETRQALRNGVDPLLVVQQQPSPLSSYRSWFEGDNFSADLFTVDGATKGIDRIRLATLDSYNGETFHVSGASGDQTSRFNRVPRTEPEAGNPVKLTVTIDAGYSGIWVPVPDGLAAAPTFTGARSSQLADGFYVSEASGTAIDVAGETNGAPGLKPKDSYTVFATPVTSDVSQLGSDSPGNSLLGDVSYPSMEQWVKLQKTPRTGEGLLQLIDRLRDRGYLSHSLIESSATAKWVSALTSRAPFAFQSSYAGHSQARIESLFTSLTLQQRSAGEKATNANLVSAVGDDEQFATAAALLARNYGFESRVVVGVRLDSDDKTLPVAPCDSVCTGANVAAWIEVRRAGSDWVTIDTSPQFADSPTTIAVGIDLPKNPTVPDEIGSQVVDPPEADRGNSELLTEPAKGDTSWLAALLPTIRVVGLSSLAALLLVLPGLVILFAKGSRRRLRRSMRVPEVSIVGAWDELVDSYVDFGIPLPKAASRLDFARATHRPAALALATIVDRAVFAEHPPGRDASTQSWELLDGERRDLADSRGFGPRLKARLNPASFLRHLGSDSWLGALLSTFGRKETLR